MNEQRILQLVLAEKGQQFNIQDFNDMLGPGVYVCLKNETPMYVGMGKNLLRRLSSLHHKRYLISECDKLLLYRTNNVNDAMELEAILIMELKPKHNVRRKYAEAAKLLGLTSSRPSSFPVAKLT